MGPTGGGKSCCYRTLQAAASRLRAQGHLDASFQHVHTHVLNPKSVKMGELYGEYNLLTNEWQDGIASSLIRAAVADQGSGDHHWVLFDGPVDAVWVENMNTVLDDNCMLCLPNGERIKLNPSTMRMLFEVQDLAVASPATVSRCGMVSVWLLVVTYPGISWWCNLLLNFHLCNSQVYVPAEDLGWRPSIRSWLSSLQTLHHMGGEDGADGGGAARRVGSGKLDEHLPAPEGYGEEVDTFLFGLFDRFVDPLLAYVRRHCAELMPSVDVNLVTSTAKIFEVGWRLNLLS